MSWEDDGYGGSQYVEDDSDWEDFLDEYDNYYQTWGWKYHLRNRIYRIKWWFWRHFGHCKTCGKRNVNCQCIPF